MYKVLVFPSEFFWSYYYEVHGTFGIGLLFRWCTCDGLFKKEKKRIEKINSHLVRRIHDSIYLEIPWIPPPEIYFRINFMIYGKSRNDSISPTFGVRWRRERIRKVRIREGRIFVNELQWRPMFCITPTWNLIQIYNIIQAICCGSCGRRCSHCPVHFNNNATKPFQSSCKDPHSSEKSLKQTKFHRQSGTKETIHRKSHNKA